MKTIVIGGAGFIGSNIVSMLVRKGCQVTVFDNLSTGYKTNIDLGANVQLIVGDIRDFESLNKAINGNDVIFHLAANVGNLRSINNPIFDTQVNVLGTLNILNSARLNNINKIVYSSSAAIFGEPMYQPINENHQFAPDTPYGVSKLAGELQCLSYNKIYGMKNVCLRYFNVFGVNQRYDAYGNVIPIFISRLLSKESISIYGNGQQTRDFVNVKDVAMANILSAEGKEISGVFNIGSGNSVTINYLANTIKKLLNDNSAIVYASERKGEVLHSLADISKAKKYLGFNPNTELANDLLEYIDWFKSEIEEAHNPKV